MVKASDVKEVLRYAKEEVAPLPYDLYGETCATKTQKIIEKAQEKNIPWEQVGCYLLGEFDGFPGYSTIVGDHTYARVAGRDIDVAFDPEAKKLLGPIHTTKRFKYPLDKYFSKRHTWGDIGNIMAVFIRDCGGRVLDQTRIGKNSCGVLVTFEQEDTLASRRSSILEEASKYGLECKFYIKKNGLTLVKFTQVGKDRGEAPSLVFSFWKTLKEKPTHSEQLEALSNG
jgi:hypothetical protein